MRKTSGKRCFSGTKCPNETSVGVGVLMQRIMHSVRFPAGNHESRMISLTGAVFVQLIL